MRKGTHICIVQTCIAKATLDFLIDYDAWATFDRGYVWCMRAYKLSASEARGPSVVSEQHQ